MRPREIEKDPDGERFHWFNWRFSGLDRARNVDGRISYIPMNFGEAPEYYRRFVDPIDVMCLKTRPMDDQGFFNFGGATTYMKAASERARIVIVETCEQLLHIYGEQESLHNSQVDYVIDRGGRERHRRWATPKWGTSEFVLAEIEDGACLQIGIGGPAERRLRLAQGIGHQGPGRSHGDVRRRADRARDRHRSDGRFLLEDDPAEARSPMERALDLFVEIDATGWIDEARAALG